MFLVKFATGLTRSVTSKRLKRAERKNSKAMSRLNKAKGNLVSSNVELAATQVSVATQLVKLTTMSEDINSKMALQSEKQAKLTALLETL
jgi:hypothetical protein